MLYWLIAIPFFIICMSLWSVALFRDKEQDEPVMWMCGVIVCGAYSALWIIFVPITILTGISVGSGWMIYKKWFKKEIR